MDVINYMYIMIQAESQEDSWGLIWKIGRGSSECTWIVYM